MDKLTILLVSDAEYLKYLKPVMRSIKKNCKGGLYRIHLHLVNIKADGPVNSELKGLVPDFEVKIVNDMVKLDKTVTKHKKGKTFSEKKSYCANVRVKVMLDLLNQGVPYLFYLDCDSLVRKDLSELFGMIKKNDITFRFVKYMKRGGWKRSTKSGGIGVKNNEKTRQFFVKYDQLVSSEEIKWGLDQKYLLKLYDEVILGGSKEGLKFVNLPEKYLDWTFKNVSPIWTGKGLTKERDRIYLKDFNKYSQG